MCVLPNDCAVTVLLRNHIPSLGYGSQPRKVTAITSFGCEDKWLIQKHWRITNVNEDLSLGNRSFVIDWMGQPSCLCLEAVLGLQLCSDINPLPSGAGWVASEVLWGSRVEDFSFAFSFRLSTFSMWLMLWKLSGSSKQWNVEWSISLKLKLPSWKKGHGITWDRTSHW